MAQFGIIQKNLQGGVRMRTVLAILTGFLLDLLIGDPHSIPHPVPTWKLSFP